MNCGVKYLANFLNHLSDVHASYLLKRENIGYKKQDVNKNFTVVDQINWNSIRRQTLHR